MSKETINNGDTGLSVRNKLNNNFSELYTFATGPVIPSVQLIQFELTTPAPLANTVAMFRDGTVGGRNAYSAQGIDSNFTYSITYNGTRWVLFKESSDLDGTVFANVGNEAEPWLATWPAGNILNISNNIRIDYLGNNPIVNTTGLHHNRVYVGNNSYTTGNNQLQLGSSRITTYTNGAVQNRSDLRDKTEIRDTVLGIDFIKALRPVDYKWDMREDYRSKKPELLENATKEQKDAHAIALTQWEESIKLTNITHDGSKKRNRFHHGLIAQEVKSVLDDKGIDFGGFQDHKIAGGDDVLSIGYSEFIGPMIKAIQELSQKLDNALMRIEVLENK